MGHPQPKYRNSAAFYDVDGTLIRINIVHAFAFYASRHPSLVDSAIRTVKTAAQLPVFWAAETLYDFPATVNFQDVAPEATWLMS